MQYNLINCAYHSLYIKKEFAKRPPNADKFSNLLITLFHFVFIFYPKNCIFTTISLPKSEKMKVIKKKKKNLIKPATIHSFTLDQPHLPFAS